MRLLRTFTTSDAVEGAVEVRLELSETLHAYRSRLRLLALALIVGVVLTLSAMILQAAGYASWIIEWLDGTGSLDYLWALLGLMYTAFFVISLSFGIAVLLFMGMMRRYFSLMRARYGTIAGGGMGRPLRRVPGPRQAEIEEEAGMMRDPARTLLGLAREAEEEVPQVDALLKYSMGFTLMLAMMSLLAAGLTLFGASHVPEGALTTMILVHGLGCVILAAAVLLQVETQRFISHFIARVGALETFEAQGPMAVPEGKDVLDRFTRCVMAKDQLERGDRVAGDLAGATGQKYAFDMVLGGPGERVLVRTYDDVPGIDQVRDLRSAAEDVARKEGELPLRVVALVGKDMDDLDVDDIVYDYLMEHPIIDERGERARSLQIVAEVEGYYAVLPFTVP
jgi:hypothetical protein